ncbi:hypothetical protein D1BOALGB6SA_10092 [Olavius sp. associated proteobacterium Delta 1]|nr:hypothetical protein D1BOALGB6SA_10092 [Olavius sp. associated proteobacterium Delta 1]
MKISYYIQSHAKSVLWIGLILCIASTTALYFSIHRDSFPQLEMDIIFITAYHGESDAIEALKNITTPLEDQINSFGDIKEILSLSSKGYVELQVILDGGGTDDLLTEIKNAVYLPYVEIEAIRAGTSQDPIIDCIFTSNYHNENDLQLSVSDLKRALEDLDIVDQVRSFGLESDPKKKGLVNVRFNGKPAIELIVHKKGRVDIIQAKNQIEGKGTGT